MVPMAGSVTTHRPAKAAAPMFELAEICSIKFFLVCGTALHGNDATPASLLKAVDSPAKANMELTFTEAGWTHTATGHH
jgi:hypothetical protein